MGWTRATDVPDVIFYGRQAEGRLGIEVAPAGDVNADGVDDLLHLRGVRHQPAAGTSTAARRMSCSEAISSASAAR